MIVRFLFALCAVSSAASAQSFNFELGPDAPPPTYGGAAQQPGTWNVVTVPAGGGQGVYNDAVVASAVDLSGVATAVSARFTSTVGIYFADPYLDSFPTGAQHAALLSDGLAGHEFLGQAEFRIDGLPSGAYEVWSYGSPNCRAAVTGAVEPAIQLSGLLPWNGYPAPGQHFLVHHVTTTGSIQIELQFPVRELTGVQLRRLDGARGTTCAGDGSGGACPCGNQGASGNGCATSFNVAGARLDAIGSASITSDALVLSANGVSNSFVTFIQGSQIVRAGEGAPFGDGLLCAGGGVIRLGMKIASGGAVSYPQAGDAPISVGGALPSYGGTFVYQTWFRDADLGFCASGTFNVSNGVYVAWGI